MKINGDDRMRLLCVVARMFQTLNQNPIFPTDAFGNNRAINQTPYNCDNQQAAPVTINSSNQYARLDSTDIPLLVKLLEQEKFEEEAKYIGLLTLASIVLNNPVLRVEIVKQGAVLPILNLLKQASEEETKYIAVVLLAYLANKNSDNQEEIVKQGAVLPILNLLKQALEEETKFKALVSLAFLAINNTLAQSEIVNQGGINVLKDIMAQPLKEKTHDVAVRILAFLAINNQANQTVIMQAGILPLLNCLCKKAHNQSNKKRVAWLLNGLSSIYHPPKRMRLT